MISWSLILNWVLCCSRRCVLEIHCYRARIDRINNFIPIATFTSSEVQTFNVICQVIVTLQASFQIGIHDCRAVPRPHNARSELTPDKHAKGWASAGIEPASPQC